ncbi:aminotransferase class IV [Paraburkholderia aspalathi]|uniref:branched-chain-amino-acid transaminase n=1 Tax=Paraburkholderia aspalathi TaxID=1324617 RepID=A0A1I7E9L4_9BURK|nr:aminotransferase class IV [Paraburkholderia aspalathi]SFU20666.1 branched-chain amino acid aminotransferase [Paraburkholderia aspalathi]
MSIIPVHEIMLSHPEHARAPHDPAFESGAAYVGRICPLSDASIPLLDLGFRHGDAAYDVVSVSKGLIFRLDDHLERFAHSCRKFRLRNPFDNQRTSEILTELVRHAGTKDAYIWWCVTRGRLAHGAGNYNTDAYENQFYAYVVPYRFIADDSVRQRGMKLQVSESFIRIPERAVDPTAKNFHWLDLQLAHFKARDEGFDLPVLCDANGNLTEAPGANIFFIKDRVVYTPDHGVLEGITRRTTMELATELGLTVRVEAVNAEQLKNADEAFVTSTAGGIMPINSVDEKVLGGEAGPGELTTELHNLYWRKRWDGWLGKKVDYNQ